MKSFYILFIGLLVHGFSSAQSSGTITDINNNAVSLDSMNGRKILVMILPLQQDTGVVNQLIRFKNRHVDSVVVIGLVCLAACNISTATISTIYAEAIRAGVIITEGIPANVSATDSRQGVLQWLSGKSLNRTTEVTANGAKYFLSESGKLYADGGKNMSLDSRMTENMVKTKVPGEGKKN